jgi:hypothetical protein
MGHSFVSKELLEGEAAAGKLLDREVPLDRRLGVEHLADLRFLADQLAYTARQSCAVLDELLAASTLDGSVAPQRSVASSETQALNRRPGTSSNASTDSPRM